MGEIAQELVIDGFGSSDDKKVSKSSEFNISFVGVVVGASSCSRLDGTSQLVSLEGLQKNHGFLDTTPLDVSKDEWGDAFETRFEDFK